MNDFARTSILSLLATVLFATTAAAQLDLPTRPDGEAPAVEEPKAGRSKGPRGLEIPAESPPAPAQPAASEATPFDRPGIDDAARAIFAELEDLGDPNQRLATQAVESLLALGDAGVAAARLALTSGDGVTLVTGARVLLRAGTQADRERIHGMLRGHLESRSVEPLLSAWVEHDPVLVTPSSLVAFLDHPQNTMRIAAERQLERRSSPSLLPALVELMRSERSDTRARSLELVARIDDPAVEPVLFEALSDPAPQVAWTAASALADRPDPAVEEGLLQRARTGPILFREGTYALLALIEREDRMGRAILEPTDAAFLLRRLEADSGLTAAVCATALAGIGFRSERPEDTPWLDLVVPHELLRTVSGAEFYRDLSSVQKPALRRLVLITGENHGSNGPEWQAWWGSAVDGFRARRAVVRVDPDEYGSVELVYRALNQGEAFVLSGPEASPEEVEGGVLAERFFLTHEESRDLVHLLRREGVLGSEVLPGTRGETFAGGARTLDVVVAGQHKRFQLGPTVDEPWFEKVTTFAVSLRDRNRWQRFVSPRFPSRLSQWTAEKGWWLANHEPARRAARLKEMVLAALPTAEDWVRDAGVRELRTLYAEEGVAELSDAILLTEALRGEPFYGERAQDEVQLALLALATAADDPELDPVRLELCRGLFEVLGETFAGEAAPAMVRTLLAAGPVLVESASMDARPFVRAVSAAALAERAAGAEAMARERLFVLLEDEDAAVEAAAVLALGDCCATEAATEILLRARVGSPKVRAAALRAAGAVDPNLAVEPLLGGLTAPDEEVRTAAAEGLARLGDPKTARVMVSLLGRRHELGVFAAGREGLLALGEASHEALLRAARSRSDPARREAAFLLAEMGVPEVASDLMSFLTDDPEDVRAAFELAILTAVDFRSDPDPAGRWWQWWDLVLHDDSDAWLRAAMERQGVPAPSAEELAAGGPQALAFLIAVASSEAPHLAERGRRELEALLGRSVASAPPAGPERALWQSALLADAGLR